MGTRDTPSSRTPRAWRSTRVLALACVLLGAACSDGDDSAVTTSSPSSTSTTETTVVLSDEEFESEAEELRTELSGAGDLCSVMETATPNSDVAPTNPEQARIAVDAVHDFVLALSSVESLDAEERQNLADMATALEEEAAAAGDPLQFLQSLEAPGGVFQRDPYRATLHGVMQRAAEECELDLGLEAVEADPGEPSDGE